MSMAEKNNISVFSPEIIEELDKCAACGTCHSICPVYNLTRDETLSARGKIQMLRALSNGELAESKIGKDLFNRCLLCYACETVCPSGVATSKIWIKAREHFSRQLGSGFKGSAIKTVSDWKYLTGALKAGRILQNTIPGMNSIPGTFRPKIAAKFLIDYLPEVVPAIGEKKYRVGYFVGCISNFFLGSIGIAAIHTLSALGCEVVIPKEQVCCGAPAFNNGELDSALKLARKNIEVFLKADVDIITSGDATCGGSFLHEYRQLLYKDKNYDEFSGKYREIHKLVLELGMDRGLKEIPAKVTYHDSCHLRHTQGVYSEPREILRSLPGVELVEMRDSELCCGFGGSYSLFHAADSAGISKDKLRNAIDSGAEALAASSPGCVLKLREEARTQELPIAVKHLFELVQERLPVNT